MRRCSAWSPACSSILRRYSSAAAWLRAATSGDRRIFPLGPSTSTYLGAAGEAGEAGELAAAVGVLVALVGRRGRLRGFSHHGSSGRSPTGSPAFNRNPRLALQGMGLNIFEMFHRLGGIGKGRAVGVGLEPVALRQIGFEIRLGLIVKRGIIAKDFGDVDGHVRARAILRRASEIPLFLRIRAGSGEDKSSHGCQDFDQRIFP